MAGKPQIVCFEIIYLSLIYSSLAFFDIEELKNFNYGIDISNEPVVLKPKEEQSDSNTIQLTSKYGQPYQCDFPNTVEQEKQKEEAEKVAMETGIPDLLKPMESSPCLRKTKDWWSYEFCYGKHVRQFHLAEDGRIDGAIMMLGYYESEYDWGDNSDKSEAEKQHSRLLKYHTQQYVNGSKCDLNGKQRRTEVRFLCEEGSGDHIARLDEPETCVYILTVHTTKICHHPFLKPPTPTRTITITCNPVLTVIQYQEYLDQIEAEEKRKEAEEEEIKRKNEENQRLAEERSKYYKDNQFKTVEEEDAEDEVEVAEEDNEGDAIQTEGLLKDQEKLVDNIEDVDTEDWSNIMKAVHKANGIPTSQMKPVKPIFKVVNNADELKEFLDEAMGKVKDTQKPSAVTAAGAAKFRKDVEAENDEEGVNSESSIEDVEEEEEEEAGSKIKKPDALTEKASDEDRPRSPTKDVETDEDDSSDMEEFDSEVKTLKEKYKHRRDKLQALKSKVRTSMEEQYANIIKEAQDELGDAPDLDEQQAVKALSKTLDGLLEKLDRTEKEIADVDKELEQFAEYDPNDPVKTVPPVRDDDPPTGTHVLPVKDDDPPTGAQGPSKTDMNDRVKVRVRRIKPASVGQSKKPVGSEISNQQTEALEKSVQKELEKAGFGEGDKIQVRIITTGYYDSDDDSMHMLSETDSETFKNLIVNIIGGSSEADKEANKHAEQEENYSFVWGKDRQTGEQTPAGILPTSDTDTYTDTQTSTQTDTHTDIHTDTQTDTQTHTDTHIDDDES